MHVHQLDPSAPGFRVLFQSPQLMLVSFCMEAGQERPLHESGDHDGFLYVVSGRVSVRLGPEEKVLGPGEMMIAPPRTPQGFKCLESATLLGGAAPSPAA